MTAGTAGTGAALAAARRVADAVLYEGYLLYPYRASAAKNQMRWQFGVLSPAGAAEAGLGEQAALHAELLLRPGPEARLELRVRCLQVQERAVQAATPAGFADVEELCAGDAGWIPWQEAVPREVAAGPFTVDDLLAGRRVALTLPGGEDVEDLRSGDRLVGRLLRARQPLAAELAVAAERADGLLRLTLDLRNTAVADPAETTREQAARRAWVSTHVLVALTGGSVVSLVDPPPEAVPAAGSCHNRGWWPALVGDGLALVAPIILPDRPAVAPESPGDFFDATEIDEMLTLRVMTLTDEEKAAARGTDPRAAAIIERCDTLPDDDLARLHGALRGPIADPAAHVSGAPPVDLADPAGGAADPAGGPFAGGPFAGGPADPAGGPFAGGPFAGGPADPAGGRFAGGPFAGGPADPAGGPFAGGPADPAGSPFAGGPAAAEPVPGEDPEVPWWDPGADAAVSPATDAVLVGGVPVAKGSRVRLRPTRRADAQDMFLAGQVALVTAVLSDVDGGVYVAVVLEDDSTADLDDWYGRYWYFAPDEVEPLPGAPTGSTGSAGSAGAAP